MKIEVNYRQKRDLADDQIEVSIAAKSLSTDVQKLISTIESLGTHYEVIPLSVNDKVVMVQMDGIIAVEVFENELTITTVKQVYQLRGKLKTMLQRLNNGSFIQISKNTVINLDHLNSLEASFSGNMTAFLDQNMKLVVSRKYLADLKKSLGM